VCTQATANHHLDRIMHAHASVVRKLNPSFI
jgi:hypothetical protein